MDVDVRLRIEGPRMLTSIQPHIVIAQERSITVLVVGDSINNVWEAIRTKSKKTVEPLLEALAGELCRGDTEQWFFFSPGQERQARGGRPSRTTTSRYGKATGSPSSLLRQTLPTRLQDRPFQLPP
ncbi:hypothetical protein VIGAN_06097300 [Vigna angularis var. angularis]|uniref:Uncharacterized protein n=1 Tax=Vigna angularis var. angularis TaxID=157739 RepID=A0A0S3SAM9_PHAAN|nr:hypothetical protein VIGAN_06097300 [Vigna angularis var. angularis]